MTSTLKLVIFDCDGVLVDSEPLANQVLCDELNAAGVAITATQTQQAFRGSSAAMCIATIGQWLGADAAQNFWCDMQARTLQVLAGVEPIPYVLDQLQWLHDSDVLFCVASAGDHEKMHTTLTATNILTRFTPPLFSAVDVPRSKPAPDLFLHAAAAMGVLPQDCVVIEDSSMGVTAAVAAGMQVLWYCRDFAEAPALIEQRNWSLKTFDDMRQLPSLLSALGLEIPATNPSSDSTSSTTGIAHD